MSLILVTVLKMAKQQFIRVYGTWGHLFMGGSAHLWGPEPTWPHSWLWAWNKRQMAIDVGKDFEKRRALR